jgi:hypothetical protein
MTFLGKPKQVSGSQVWDGGKFIGTRLDDFANRTKGRDDFDNNITSFWDVQIGTGASLSTLANGALFSALPNGNGIAVLNVSSDDDNVVSMLRSVTGLVRDVGEPIVTDWKFTTPFGSGSFNWLMGLTGPDRLDGPFSFFGYVDVGAGPKHYLVVSESAGFNLNEFTMPPLTGNSYRARLIIDETKASLQIANDEQQYSLIATSSVAPVGMVYSPYIQSWDATTDRALALDYVEWDSKRQATDGTSGPEIDKYFKQISAAGTSGTSNTTLSIDGGGSNENVTLADSPSLIRLESTTVDVDLTIPSGLDSGPRWWYIKTRENGGFKTNLVWGAGIFVNGTEDSSLEISAATESLWILIRVTETEYLAHKVGA